MQISQSQLRLAPDEGELHYRDSCAPSLDSDEPVTDFSPEWRATACA